jgi:hypothetical protein
VKQWRTRLDFDGPGMVISEAQSKRALRCAATLPEPGQLDHHSKPVPNDLALDDPFVCDADVFDEKQASLLPDATTGPSGVERSPV